MEAIIENKGYKNKNNKSLLIGFFLGVGFCISLLGGLGIFIYNNSSSFSGYYNLNFSEICREKGNG